MEKGRDLPLNSYSEWIANVHSYTGFIAQNIQVPVSCALQFGMDKATTEDLTSNVDDFMIAKHDKIAIMAYRDFAQGNDSIIYHVQAEFDSAEALNKADCIIIAVETITTTPDKVTFAEEGRAVMYKELQAIDWAFKGHKSYAGHAIHALTNWMNLFM